MSASRGLLNLAMEPSRPSQVNNNPIQSIHPNVFPNTPYKEEKRDIGHIFLLKTYSYLRFH